MTQTMKTKHSKHCRICNARLVSSTNRDCQRTRFISMNDKQILTRQFMNQHENDLDPGPLTVTGFNGGSCCRTVSPGFNRKLVESTSKGHRWIRSQSNFSFIAWDNDVAENLSHERSHKIHFRWRKTSRLNQLINIVACQIDLNRNSINIIQQINLQSNMN